MAHVTGTDLYDLQYDSLTTDTGTNPQMTYSPVTALNKKMGTNSKKVVGAINEIFSKANTTAIGFQNFTDFYNSLIGDANTDPTLQIDLQKIDTNLIQSLLKVYKEIHGEDLSNPIPLPIGKTVAELLNQTSTQDKEFLFSDLTTDSISLGTIKANETIYEVVLIIEDEFDNNLQISLGTDLAQGLLMTVNDNCTDVINQYSIECNQTFTTDTEIKMFLFNYSGLTKGKGKIIIKTK